MPEHVVSLEEALRIVADHARRLAARPETESVELPSEPQGRVLARPITATRDQPPFDRSTRDGFAVRARDLQPSNALKRIGLVRAGDHWQGPPLARNEAIEIMTGAPLPPRADCVLMIEHAERNGDEVRPQRTLQPGENVVPRGAEAHAGDTLLAPGHPLDAAAIAIAAGCGMSTVSVFAQPTVAILATGDELIEPGEDMAEDWQIYNSNTYAIASLVAAAGGSPRKLPIARDRREGPDGLDERIATAAMWDLMLVSGGVSVGQFDLVEQTLAGYGAEFFFTGVRIQPGKPVVFGRLPKHGEWTYFFGLPGNPVSTEVCFHLFAATMLRALAGRSDFAPQFVAATAAERFEPKPSLTRLLPCRLESTFRRATVRPVPWQGSGDTAANARANGYCVVEETGVAEGSTARVLLR